MKKSISILLCILLVFCAIPFAASAETETVVDVQVVWDDIKFVYSPKWDYGTFSYVDDANGWKAVSDANKITVTNSSAFGITVTFDCAEMADGISFNFYDSSMNLLSSPASLTLAASERGTVRILPVGVLSSDSVENTALGKVVINIATDAQS